MARSQRSGSDDTSPPGVPPEPTDTPRTPAGSPPPAQPQRREGGTLSDQTPEADRQAQDPYRQAMEQAQRQAGLQQAREREHAERMAHQRSGRDPKQPLEPSLGPATTADQPRDLTIAITLTQSVVRTLRNHGIAVPAQAEAAVQGEMQRLFREGPGGQ